jgi:hypothetical protein
MSSLDLILWKNLRIGAILAMDSLNSYNKTLYLGSLDLEMDLMNSKPYDHDNPKGNYNDKNAYFDRTNNLGISFLRLGATGFSKMYYWRMLNTINNHEKQYQKPLNKGIVCGNLGVSALAEGDIDGGITYLIWAAHEDRGWVKGDPTKNSFALPLYVQFAEGTNREGRSQFGRPAPWVMLKTAIKKYNADYNENVNVAAIFEELEGSPEHRAILEGSLWTIHRNLCLLREENERKIYRDENNIFTRLRLFDGVIGLCRFIELRMRYHESVLKILDTKTLKNVLTKPLGNLLNALFRNEPWYQTDVKSKIRKPQTPRSFNNFVKKEMTQPNSHARSILLLLVIRNYSAHICDPDTPFFFEKFEDIFNEIIAAYVYYLKFRNIAS